MLWRGVIIEHHGTDVPSFWTFVQKSLNDKSLLPKDLSEF